MDVLGDVLKWEYTGLVSIQIDSVTEDDVILYYIILYYIILYYMCWGVIFHETETAFTIINHNFLSY